MATLILSEGTRPKEVAPVSISSDNFKALKELLVQKASRIILNMEMMTLDEIKILRHVEMEEE